MENDVLTKEQVEKYHNDGFLKVDQMFSHEEIEEISQAINELAEAEPTPGKHWMYFEQSLKDKEKKIINRIEKFVEHNEKLNNLVNGRRIIGSASQLLNDNAVLFKEKINYKLAGGDGFKAHQDIQAGWDDYTKQFISALVTIDPNTEENGCLEIDAGHHKRQLFGTSWKPLEGEQLKGINWKKVPTQKGDVLFFDGYAPHQSGPNLTNSSRRNLYLTYNKLSDGDHREKYYSDKHKNYPPDVERNPDKTYKFRV